MAWLDMSAHALPLERFTYNKEDKSLSAFESDLRNRPFDGTYPWLHRLYDDACDEGIAIRSHHTGVVQRFYLERTEERDGDLLAWHFKPTHQNQNIKSVVIFND